MTTEQLNNKLVLQPVNAGATIPTSFDESALYLFNLSEIRASSIWDDLGTKESIQSSQIRNLAKHLNKIADHLEQLGSYLSSIPDSYEYDNGVYKETLDEIYEVASDTTEEDYKKLIELIEELEDDASQNFMD